MWIVQHKKVEEFVYGPFKSREACWAWFRDNFQHEGDYLTLELRPV